MRKGTVYLIFCNFLLFSQLGVVCSAAENRQPGTDQFSSGNDRRSVSDISGDSIAVEKKERNVVWKEDSVGEGLPSVYRRSAAGFDGILDYDKLLRARLQLGTRMAYRFLTKGDSGHKWGVHGSGTFLGTIYSLKEKQDMMPLQLYASWYFTDYIGVELAYDQLEVETAATNIYHRVVKNDGNLKLSGPTLMLLGRYPNLTQFTPWAGVGLGFYRTSFDAASYWAHNPGFRNSYSKMSTSNTYGFLFAAGVDWAIMEHWNINLSLQYLSAEVDAVFRGYLNDKLYTTQSGSFPMDNIAIRLGAAYQF